MLVDVKVSHAFHKSPVGAQFTMFSPQKKKKIPTRGASSAVQSGLNRPQPARRVAEGDHTRRCRRRHRHGYDIGALDLVQDSHLHWVPVSGWCAAESSVSKKYRHPQATVCSMYNGSQFDSVFDCASDGTSSASESSVDVEPRVAAPKKRKTTYYQRKDEIEDLQEQLKLLQAQLEKQREKTPDQNLPLHTNRAGAVGGGSLQDAMNIERNNLRLAGTQSMMSAYNLSRSEGSIPLHVYLHLPDNQETRAALLNEMRDSRLDTGMRYMIERTRFLDLRNRHRQRECFELPSGDLVSTGLEVVLFDEGHSLQQVYEEFLYFMCHQEMSISAKLGILTIRESEQFGQYHHTRLLSSLPEGLEIESNVAMFARCVPSSEATPGYAIGTINHVTQDDMYPYRPDSCGRLDISGAVVLTEVPSPSGKGTAIAMSSWNYVRFCAPNYSVPSECEHSVQRLMEWITLVPKEMTERLALLEPPVREGVDEAAGPTEVIPMRCTLPTDQ